MGQEQLSREWHREDRQALSDRRAVTGLACGAVGAMTVVALYQVGVLAHLPDPPLGAFDSERIVRSPEAYRLLSTPDAVLAMASYAVTAVLAGMGAPDRARERPWLPLALACKVGFDVYQAAAHTVNQWTTFRAFCSWCLGPAVASLAMVPRIVPETRVALSTISSAAARC
jgi:uncharacterized membrane protein